jgi:hypothetical protein
LLRVSCASAARLFRWWARVFSKGRMGVTLHFVCARHLGLYGRCATVVLLCCAMQARGARGRAAVRRPAKVRAAVAAHPHAGMDMSLIAPRLSHHHRRNSHSPVSSPLSMCSESGSCTARTSATSTRRTD